MRGAFQLEMLVGAPLGELLHPLPPPLAKLHNAQLHYGGESA